MLVIKITIHFVHEKNVTVFPSIAKKKTFFIISNKKKKERENKKNSNFIIPLKTNEIG